MPALNFKKEFAPLVESGEKKQTIRQVRKNPIENGDTLYLYTGMRTKQCRKLGEVICTGVHSFRIGTDWEDRVVHVDGRKASGVNDWLVDEIAKNDGFSNTHDFFNFFIQQYGLPFNGVLITWD